jgi:hypothetical protein
MADEEGRGWLMKKDSVTRKVDEELHLSYLPISVLANRFYCENKLWFDKPL